MKYILTLMSALLLFVSCDDGDNSGNQKASRAVLIYMAGENNLTYHPTSGTKTLKFDLEEILEGSKLLANNQRLFVFVDSLGINSQYKGKPYLMEVKGGKGTKVMEYSNDPYSCDPELFRDVVSWVTTKVSADSYGLVLWGHATGWFVENDTLTSSSRRAYGGDTYGDNNGDTSGDLGTKDSRWMNITQMVEALSGLPKFKFIFADCCNMVCAECGYEMRNVTDYLIGSSAEIPGPGAPYDKIVPYLYKDDSALYKGIIDTYYDYYLELYKTSYPGLSGHSVPLSVIDTKYIAQLATATHNVLSQIEGGYPTYPNTPNMTGLAMYQYYDEPALYDMRAFIKRNVSASAFQAWDQVYSLAVPYYRMSMKWMTIYNDLRRSMEYFDQDITQYGCVSMHVPLDLTAYYYGHFAYNTRANNYGWNRIIDWGRFGW